MLTVATKPVMLNGIMLGVITILAFFMLCHKAKRSYAKFCSAKSHSLCSVLLVNQAHCVESIKMMAVILTDIMPTV